MRPHKGIADRLAHLRFEAGPRMQDRIYTQVMGAWLKSRGLSTGISSSPGVRFAPTIHQSRTFTVHCLGREIMQSRITHIAAAAAVAVGLLFLARHLVGGQATVKGPDVHQARDVNQDTVPILDQGLLEPVQAEFRRADEFLARCDVDGLVDLLQTGLDQTKLKAALYLGQIGDSRALGTLQRLAGQWQGPAQDNPFVKAAEQIRQRTTLPTDANRPPQGPAGPNQPQADAKAQQEGVLLLTVVDAKTQKPVAGAEVLARFQYQGRPGVEEVLTTDRSGQCPVDWASHKADALTIRILSEQHVVKDIPWNPKGLGIPIPKTYVAHMNEGVTIGGVVKTESGEPLADVMVRVSSIITVGHEVERDIALFSVRAVKTDDQGRWQYRHFPAGGQASIELEHTTYVTADRYDPTPSLESLISQGCVLLMRPGLAVAGSVSDQQGHPISGAEVFEGSGYSGWDDRYDPAIRAITDAQGRFEFQRRRAGDTVLTVVAAGFAQDMREVRVNEGMSDVEFVLEPGHTLMVQVVDPSGRGIQGVSATAWTWRRVQYGNRTYNNIRGKAITDKAGLAVIHDLPADEVLYAIGKEGLAPLDGYPLTASDQVQTVTMVPLGRLTGRVLDASTGQAVNAFTVTVGIQWKAGGDVVWQQQMAKHINGQRYEMPFLLHNLGMAVRIEAQGYLPAQTEVFFNDGTDQVRDVTLTAGKGLTGIVHDPDGVAAKAARVVIAAPRCANIIRDGQILSPEDPMHVITADTQGRFTFPPPERAFRLVAVDEAGIAEVDEETFCRTPEIHLEAWGRVEGAVYSGKDPVANQQVRVNVQLDGVESDLVNPITVQYYNEGQTDGQGRFAFRKVRPGPTVVQSKGSRQVVDVRPGQITQVTLGGGGRKARARLVLPADTPPLDLLKSQVTISRVFEEPFPELPVPLPEDFLLMNPVQQRAWWLAWLQTPAGQRFRQASEREHTEFANCMATLEAGGELRLADILPGRYELTLDFHNPDPSVWDGRAIVTSQDHVFEVPIAAGEAYYTDVVDLGEIPVRVVAPAKAQRPAPPFVLDASDGRTIRLSDVQGRFILLDILGEPLSQQTLTRHQILRQIHATYSSAGRLEIISVIPNVAWPVSAQMAGPLRAFTGKRQLPWTVGIISESHSREFYQGYYQPDAISRLGLGHYLSCVLIGPDGTVLALDIPQDQLQDVVAKAMQGP